MRKKGITKVEEICQYVEDVRRGRRRGGWRNGEGKGGGYDSIWHFSNPKIGWPVPLNGETNEFLLLQNNVMVASNWLSLPSYRVLLTLIVGHNVVFGSHSYLTEFYLL